MMKTYLSSSRQESIKASIPASLAAATGALSLIWFIKRTRRRNQKSLQMLNDSSTTTDNANTVIQLMPLENSVLMMNSFPSISSITWYRGDVNAVKEPLQQRICEILRSNPWLAGRLKKNDDGEIVLVHGTSDAVLSKVDSIFKCYNDGNDDATIILKRNEPCETMWEVLEPALVPNSSQLVGEDNSFWRVSLIPAFNESEQDGGQRSSHFALVTSLAHCIGDGHTYYTIQNMLDLSKETETTNIVSRLNARRKEDMPLKIEQVLGGTSYACMVSNPPVGFMLRFLRGILCSVLFGPKLKLRVFMVDENWIKDQKQQKRVDDREGTGDCATNTTTSGPSYVSTNDIITSQLLKSSDCDQAIMAINFRNKLPYCLDTDAGNYFNHVIFRPKDYETPWHVREILNDVQTSSGRNTEKPGCQPMTSWEHITSMKQFALCTNWSTFCKPVSMGMGCNQEIHLPLMPADSASIPPRFCSGAVVFRPGLDEKVAVLFTGHPKVWTNLEASGMVGEDIY